MVIVCVLCLFLFLIAALGSSWWWRPAPPTPWYGGSAFLWACFLLALYLMWPTFKALL